MKKLSPECVDNIMDLTSCIIAGLVLIGLIMMGWC